MRHAYVIRRIAPQGYVAVTKPLAELVYNAGKPVTLCGNKVSSYHVFNGWYLGYTIQSDSGNSFQSSVESYVLYSSSELLKYPVFYVKKEDSTFHTSLS